MLSVYGNNFNNENITNVLVFNGVKIFNYDYRRCFSIISFTATIEMFVLNTGCTKLSHETLQPASNEHTDRADASIL